VQGALFEPLGIVDVEWRDLNGMPSAASGLRPRPRDVAKVGSVYLHDGRWRERQIVPADWVRESTRRALSIPPPRGRPDLNPGYGYQWRHICPQVAHGIVEYVSANGNGEQRIGSDDYRRTRWGSGVSLKSKCPTDQICLERQQAQKRGRGCQDADRRPCTVV